MTDVDTVILVTGKKMPLWLKRTSKVLYVLAGVGAINAAVWMAYLFVSPFWGTEVYPWAEALVWGSLAVSTFLALFGDIGMAVYDFEIRFWGLRGPARRLPLLQFAFLLVSAAASVILSLGVVNLAFREIIIPHVSLMLLIAVVIEIVLAFALRAERRRTKTVVVEAS